MRHMFSENPLPSYINKYTGGTVWGYSTAFYDSYVFYQTETINGTSKQSFALGLDCSGLMWPSLVHEAAFLGRALPIPEQQGGFSSAWATYAVTDDPLSELSIDAVTKGMNASFSGCSNTNETPYMFNITASTLLGAFTDRGGGKTSYYTLVNGTTTASFNGVITKGAIAGIFEEYEAPSTNDGTQDPSL